MLPQAMRLSRVTFNAMTGAGVDGEPRVTAEVDYGNVAGYFVRLDFSVADVEQGRPDGDWHYIALTPDEADALGKRLHETADRARTNSEA
jgi:hypothetical protein